MEHTLYNVKHGGCELPTHTLQDLADMTQTPWTHTHSYPPNFLDFYGQLTENLMSFNNNTGKNMQTPNKGVQSLL